MEVGTVLRFDEARGFGFIEADHGGDDVFVHASALESEERVLVRGARVAFEAVRGDRGRRATVVRVLGLPPAHRPPIPEILSQPAADSPSAQQVSPLPAVPSTASEAIREPESEVCDLLSVTEFGMELTSILLDTSDELTAAQIVAIRSRLLAAAEIHGWIEG